MTPQILFAKMLPQVAVSPETLARLETYARLLAQWNSKINLVGPKTLSDVWVRHILDSAQLLPHIQSAQTLVDIGSGAGFPGLVLSMMANIPATLIESDQRKGIFMREVSRETKTLATILTERIEEAAPVRADVLTARALAPLADLLPLAYRHLKNGGRAVFLKGAGWQQEVAAAHAAGEWAFQVEHSPSVTDSAAAILVIKDIRPRNRAEEGA